jgi:hypothetical protein
MKRMHLSSPAWTGEMSGAQNDLAISRVSGTKKQSIHEAF